jgi:ankyrin repeat protein
VLDTAQKNHPDLMYVAASRQRWDAVRLLLDLGFRVNLPDGGLGPSPLHYAAGAGELDLARTLVERGADVAAHDPIFDDTPLGWSKHLHQDDTATYLGQLSPS